MEISLFPAKNLRNTGQAASHKNIPATIFQMGDWYETKQARQARQAHCHEPASERNCR